MTIPEARIQQETERAQIGARSGTATRPRTSPSPMPLGPSGGAHPLTSPLSSQFPESFPWPGIRDEIPTPRHEQRAMSKSESFGQLFLTNLFKMYKF